MRDRGRKPLERALQPQLLPARHHAAAVDVQRVAQTFFEQKQIALTILGNLDGLKIGREDLVC